MPHTRRVARRQRGGGSDKKGSSVLLNGGRGQAQPGPVAARRRHSRRDADEEARP